MIESFEATMAERLAREIGSQGLRRRDERRAITELVETVVGKSKFGRRHAVFVLGLALVIGVAAALPFALVESAPPPAVVMTSLFAAEIVLLAMAIAVPLRVDGMPYWRTRSGLATHLRRLAREARP